MKAAIQAAGQQAAKQIATQLRAEAHASGWPKHAIRALNVEHGDDGFNVVSRAHHGLIQDLEYGTESTAPTAAIHKVSNRPQDAEAVFAAVLDKVGQIDLPAI